VSSLIDSRFSKFGGRFYEQLTSEKQVQSDLNVVDSEFVRGAGNTLELFDKESANIFVKTCRGKLHLIC